jgi:hypothetical protein
VPQPGEALFERMVSEFKRPGRAGGGGFYDYPAGGKKVLWSGLKQFEKAGVTYDLEELKKRFAEFGAVAAPTTPDGFNVIVKNEIAKWSKVIRDAGIKAE